MSIFKRGQTWYADITIPNKPRFRGSLGTADKAEAKRLHDELKVKLRQNASLGHTWYEAITVWLQAEERSKDERSVLLRYDPGDIPLDQITAESFSIHHHKPATYRRYVNLFKSVLNVAKSRGLLDKVPEFPTRSIPPGRIRWLTRDEWSRLYSCLPEHLKPMALFAVSTGLRQANVLGMEWSRIDLNRAVCWIKAEEMKNKSAHGIPLNQGAMTALDMVKGQHARWCFTYAGKKMETIGEAWKRSLAKAEIEDFTWHDLRHTWASWHVQAGTSLDRLQRLGGWKDISMVLKYGHLAPEHLASAAQNLDVYVPNFVHKPPKPS